MRSVPKPFFILFIVLSFLGFLDASYLALEHYLGRVPVCVILEGCEVVTTSPYATIEGTVSALTGVAVSPVVPRGISVALLGSIYYLFIFIVSIAAMDKKEGLLLKIAPWTRFIHTPNTKILFIIDNYRTKNMV